MTFQQTLDDLTEKALAKLDDGPKYREKNLSNEQLILALVNTPIVAETLQKWIDKKEQVERGISSKNYEKGENLRKEGNRFYVAGQNARALELYNDSIRHYPRPLEGNKDIGSNENHGLSLAYGNRSAVFFNEKKFQKCLNDIDKAIQLNYPEDLKHKLLKRKAECQMALGDILEAKATLPQAKDSICQHKKKIKNTDQLLSAINSLSEKISNLSTSEIEQDEKYKTDETFKVKYESNEILQNASDGVVIGNSVSAGRCLVAKKKFKPGDVLILEKPYASTIFQNFYKSQCWHCCKTSDDIIPCFNCSVVTYCSEKCQTDSWKENHFLECHHAVKLQHLGIATIALHILLKNDLQTLSQTHFAFLESSSHDMFPYGSQDEKYSTGYKSVYHLITNAKEMPFCDIIQYGIMAVALLLILKQSKFFERDEIVQDKDKIELEYGTIWKDTFSDSHLNNVDFMELLYGSLLCKHIHQVVCNGIAVTGICDIPDPKLSALSQYGQLRYGTGIYPTVSLMNHSCDPNCIQSFANNTLIIKVAKDIEPHQELTISYGPIYSKHKWDERQHTLKKQYFFTCQCPKCQSGPNGGTGYMDYKCQHCAGPIPDLDYVVCMACNKPIDKSWFLDLHNKSAALYMQCIGEPEQSIKMLRQCLKMQKLIYYKYHRSLAHTYNALAYIMADEKRYSEAVDHFEKSLDILGAIHGDDSVEMGHNLVTYSELLMEVLKEQMSKCCLSGENSVFELASKCLNVVQKALNILTNTTSMTSGSDFITDLKAKEKHLKGFLKGSELLNIQFKTEF